MLTRRLATTTMISLLSGCLGFHQGSMPGEPAGDYLDIDGVRVRILDVAATDGDSGEPLVLLHGFASSLETWTPLMHELVRHHRVIALDLKGFGWTDRPPGDYSPKAQAALVAAVMHARGIEK